jgi:uncharacterized membrane protein YcaP (DUF421 family)
MGSEIIDLVKPDIPVLEIVFRGTVVYLAIFVLLRVIVKQAAGSLNLADLLLIVLIADAAQNAMAGEYNSIGDGLLLVATLAFWNLAIDWLGFHFEPFGRWVHPPPMKIVENGIILRRNMRKELIGYEELMTFVRRAGGTDPTDVKAAWVEGNGEVSVILFDSDDQSRPERSARAGAG